MQSKMLKAVRDNCTALKKREMKKCYCGIWVLELHPYLNANNIKLSLALWIA